MTPLFISANNERWASSRMRAYWVAKAMGAPVVMFDDFQEPGESDTLIWQKSIDTKFVKAHPELRHYWDVCDPTWWWSPTESRAAAECVNGVVASSSALADDFNRWYGDFKAVCIPDRLDLSHFPIQRQHTDVSPVRFIWYGMAVNRIALFAGLVNLERLTANGYPVELTLYDDAPEQPLRITDMFPFYHIRWDVKEENRVIAAHDVAFLPPYPGPWGRVKSHNKMLTAHACNVPVVDGQDYDDMVMAMNPARRAAVAALERRDVEERWQVSRSAEEWGALLNG